MYDSLSRRAIVRLVCFGIALVLILSGLAWGNYNRAKVAQRQLEYHYLKSVDDLGNYLEIIESALTKTMYSGTAQSMTAMTSKLWRESGFAKDCVSMLPMSELNLENTYKFLSQVGDYSVALSRKMGNNKIISNEERQNLAQMKEYTQSFLQEILALQDAIRTGSISFEEVKKDIQQTTAVSTKNNFSDGFSEFEEGFTTYPTLIYDGPFSDHILQKEPEMAVPSSEISREEARTIAAKVSGAEVSSLKDDTDEEGNMPSYCFKTDSTNVAILKQGGLVNYFITNRQVSERNLTVEECSTKANEYLKNLGIENLKQTYHEISDNKLTINFAHTENEVVCYTDLVKISVGMDNGEILDYDGRGYITNHKARGELTAKISQADAMKSLSPLLTVKGVQMSLIPDSGLSEVLCYEFKCTSGEDDNILVYVNAETGAEQQILILHINENGTLAT